MDRRHWFEVSDEGWRRLHAGRPLAVLVKEAIQNSFDEGVSSVEVDIVSDHIVVEDDSQRGFVRAELVYTIFLTDKEDSPTKRGRKGSGLKELISAMDEAQVETVGWTVIFDKAGRKVVPNRRRRGTKITLWRHNPDIEIREAVKELCMAIPPKATTLRINAQRVQPPKVYLILSPCYLDTVMVRGGVERVVERATEIRLCTPRPGERSYLFEMGLPVEAIHLPWHVDVQQRIPLNERRNSAHESYKMGLKGLLFETLVERYLNREDLREDWVPEVLTNWNCSSDAVAAYVTKAFPPKAVLAGQARANDRARQLGATVVDTTTMPRGVYATLARVMEGAEDYVRRKEEEFREQPVEPSPVQLRYRSFARWVASEVLDVDLKVIFIRKEANSDGLVEDASFDRNRMELRINVLGKVTPHDPLNPTSLAILFHEMAHLQSTEHDHRFMEELQAVAGKAAMLLAITEPEALRAFLTEGEWGRLS